MTTEINWKELAHRIEALEGRPTTASEGALHALEILIGERQLQEAVDEFLADYPSPTGMLIRRVLSLLRPASAMVRCLEVYRLQDRSRALLALGLLRSVADRRVLPWIEEFLSHPEASIRAAGIALLHELVRRGDVQPGECEAPIRRAKSDAAAIVREQAAMIDDWLTSGEAGDSPGLIIATQRRETLIGVSATHYFAFVVVRVFYLRHQRDQIFLRRAALDDPRSADEVLVHDIVTSDAGLTDMNIVEPFDLRAYLVLNQVKPALGLARDTPLYWGVDEEGLYVKPSVLSEQRSVLVSREMVRILFPALSRDTHVLEVFQEGAFWFAVLECGIVAFNSDVLQVIVPIHAAAISRALASFHLE